MATRYSINVLFMVQKVWVFRFLEKRDCIILVSEYSCVKDILVI